MNDEITIDEHHRVLKQCEDSLRDTTPLHALYEKTIRLERLEAKHELTVKQNQDLRHRLLSCSCDITRGREPGM